MPKILKPEPPVHILIVDTNVLWFKDKGPAVDPEFDKFWDENKALLRMELVVPEVVRDELMFQHCASGRKLIEKVTEHIAEFSSVTAKKHRHRLTEESMRKLLDSKFERWLKGKDAKIVPIPMSAIDWRELYKRAIWRIPPFALDAKNPDNEKGFRDALIHETVVDMVMTEVREVNFAFVSNDGVLRASLEERLKDQKKFLAFESLAALVSYIKLTREQLTEEFIGKILRRVSEKFHTRGDENCLWLKEKIGDRLLAIKEAWQSVDKETQEINDIASLKWPGPTLSSLASPPGTAPTSPRWLPTAYNTWYILQHAFLKTSELRTYHWRTTVLSLRKYILSDGQVTSDERIERVEFKVLWKANVKADARFHDVVLEETSFDNRQFRSPTPAEVQQFGLARYTTPYQA